MPEISPPSLPSRRVVMLVDNDVKRDSRVQKQAVSMAARGWQVTLLGLGRKRRSSWTIGDATVRLVPYEPRSRPNVRSLRWRDPLARPSLAIARHRAAELHGRVADQAAATAGDRALPTRARRALRRTRAKLGEIRLERTEAAAEARRTHSSPVDRMVAGALRRVHGDRAWRWLDPTLLDVELAMGAEIDRLRPDLIHANDFRTLGVAARAKQRARAEGREVKIVWDAHEYLAGVNPWQTNARWLDAQLAHEREYAPASDGVATVSGELADLLQADYGLAVRPTVVMNCPVLDSFHAVATGRRLRDDLGVADDVPVMVYSGSARAARGLDVMVEALPQLTDVVCAVVVSDPQSEYITSLASRARELGVADRFKAVPYVPADEVAHYLSGATVGVIPILHFLNHEIALITKFFEYAHAGLPIVTSDVRAMASEVRRTGVGEVFVAEDVADFVTAMRKVLTDPRAYEKVYRDTDVLASWTWEQQADRLHELYGSLMR